MSGLARPSKGVGAPSSSIASSRAWSWNHSTEITFGSAHPSGINAVFGDGSVRAISYGISATMFNRIGHRADGQVIEWSE